MILILAIALILLFFLAFQITMHSHMDSELNSGETTEMEMPSN